MTHDALQTKIPPDVLSAAELLRSAGGEAFVVGGAVRDLLRGVSPGDFDLATNLHTDRVQKCFPFSAPTGIAHGTVTVWLNSKGAGPGLEVTTYRGEGAYSDGRHPDQVFFVKNIEDDLARRDFTINAMALDPVSGRVVDPYGGQKDLAAGVLRAVGDPVARFSEDGLRAMRAVRFAATLSGNRVFAIEPDTFAAIAKTLAVVRKVSAERLRDELLKMLTAAKPSVGFELMRESGLLEVVLPELLEGVGMTQNHHHAFSVYDHTLHCIDAAVGRTARLGALFHDIGKPRTRAPKENAPGEFTFHNHEVHGAEMTDQVMRRLRFSNEEREKIIGLVRHHMFWYDPEWSPGAVRRFVRRVGESNLEDLYALRRADIAGRGRDEDSDAELAPLQARVEQVLTESRAMKVTDLKISGGDVMRALGIPASRRVGDLLDALLDRVLEHPELNTKENLLALLPELSAK